MKKENTETTLSLGKITGDFLTPKNGTLHSGGCCCCCCCLFWIGGVIGTTIGAVQGARAKSNVKGDYYRHLIRIFWLSVVGLTLIPLLSGFINDDYALAVLIAAPAAQLVLALLIVLGVGTLNEAYLEQRRTAYSVCIKTVIGGVVGYGIGWGVLGLLAEVF